ncbi:MAG: hypothetical protein ACOYMA_10970 [Bacteroidia bacterium]
MKASILFLFLSLALIVNANDAINYQAVIRSSDGKVVSSKSIAVQMTIFNDIQSQNMVYKENHATETNEFGMINLKIGLGQSVFGVFDNINWSTGTFYVQVAVDFTGGNSYEIIGISQLLSVPYALYAKKSGDLNVANMSDAFVKELADKLGISKPSVIDAKVSNPDYSPIAETKDVVVYQTKSNYSIEAVLGTIAVAKTYSTTFKISQTGVNGLFDIIANLNSTNFPNLIEGSTLLKILLLPWDRNSSNTDSSNGWRCIVITTKGQIYHNFPNRTPSVQYPDGLAQVGDINKWDESVVWDLPNRRIPSKTSDSFPYSLNPCLPQGAYELYPAINNDNGYGNGGFNITNTSINNTLARFYFHNRSSDTYVPFFFMGGFETTKKLQIIGTYRSNTSALASSRICVFTSTDGGRQWYNKYEFACDQPTAFGNALVGKNTSEDYITNSLILQKRDFITPSATLKDPVDYFSYGGNVSIQTISKSDSLVINTSTPHNLKNGDLIVIKKGNQGISSNFDFLCNNDINSKNGGNGKVWKIGVLSPTSIKLYEYVHSPDNNIPARHIHAINRTKDGFIITTGEIYPQGWIVYMQVKNLDNALPIDAKDNFNFIRLNSTKNGLQRSLGTLMLNNADQTIIFASDEALISNSSHSIEGRSTLVSRSSTGVYKGSLADIDDFSKFTCIYEAEQVAYFFKEINDMWIFCGQQGELAISIDKGISWRKFMIYNKDNLAMQFPKGTDNLGRFFLDQVIIYRK